jgi:hypothetical protein
MSYLFWCFTFHSNGVFKCDLSLQKMSNLRDSMFQAMESEGGTNLPNGFDLREFVELISDLRSLRRKQAFSEMIIGSICTNAIIYLNQKEKFLTQSKVYVDLRASNIYLTSRQALSFMIRPMPTAPSSDLMHNPLILYLSPQLNSNDTNTIFLNTPIAEAIWQVYKTK